jgi:hypothetical protein
MRHAINLFALVWIAGCGTDAGEPPPDAGPIIAPDAAGTCKVVDNVAAPIEVMRVAEAMPAPLGGTLPDGTYHLTAMRIYTGPGGATGGTGSMGAETSYLVNGRSHLVTLSDGLPSYATYTLEPAGTAIAVTQTCPNQQVTAIDGFTQSGGVVTLYESSTSVARVYTRVP